jgi:hypothetical protein
MFLRMLLNVLIVLLPCEKRQALGNALMKSAHAELSYDINEILKTNTRTTK